jgi:hypothetical protein
MRANAASLKTTTFQDLLSQALLCSEINGKFSASEFFNVWFKKKGESYFFLFRKNLAVTNIQFGELLALIRAHTLVKSDSSSSPNNQFLNPEEFKSAISDIVECFPRNKEDPIARYRVVAQLYESLLRRAVVIQAFRGSAAAYIPPHLEINLLPICAHSGYIHSCGRAIYIQDVGHSRKKEFFDALRCYLEPRSKSTRRVFFTVYADEDFSDHDRDHAADLRHGLDDVKVHVEKFYMGRNRLVDILQAMREEFTGSLEVPAPQSFRLRQRQFLQQKGADSSKTLWLIVDRMIRDASSDDKAHKHYICFEQQYINHNPFYIFDENKPAWCSSTTMPHTLMGAMINLSLPYWPREGKVVLGEPFAGTGTTWLEALKFGRLRTEASDLEPFSPLLAFDNLSFFSTSDEELTGIQKKLRAIKGSKVGELAAPKIAMGRKKNDEILRAYEWAVESLNRCISSEGALLSSREIAYDLFSKSDLFSRILFYLGLKATLKNVAAFERESRDWETAFYNEIQTMLNRIDVLLKLKKRQKSGLKKEHTDSILVFQDRYSQGCTVNPSVFLNELQRIQKEEPVKIRDARQLAFGKYDLIITDPPYGFNTEEDTEELASLYAEMIPAMIRALKPQGQLLLCLPDRSHTGRLSPLFTHKEIVIQQVLAAADEQGREVIQDALTVPAPSELFVAPFYWEAERSLRRAILHFRLRSKGVHPHSLV